MSFSTLCLLVLVQGDQSTILFAPENIANFTFFGLQMESLYYLSLLSVFQQFLELWSAGVTWLAYLVPSYAMSGLYAQSTASFDGFYLYLGKLHLRINGLYAFLLRFLFSQYFSSTMLALQNYKLS